MLTIPSRSRTYLTTSNLKIIETHQFKKLKCQIKKENSAHPFSAGPLVIISLRGRSPHARVRERSAAAGANVELAARPIER